MPGGEFSELAQCARQATISVLKQTLITSNSFLKQFCRSISYFCLAEPAPTACELKKLKAVCTASSWASLSAAYKPWHENINKDKKYFKRAPGGRDPYCLGWLGLVKGRNIYFSSSVVCSSALGFFNTLKHQILLHET